MSREAQSRIAKARWDDPIAGAKWRAALRDSARREKIAKTSAARWADPEMRAKIIAGMKAAQQRRRERIAAEASKPNDALK